MHSKFLACRSVSPYVHRSILHIVLSVATHIRYMVIWLSKFERGSRFWAKLGNLKAIFENSVTFVHIFEFPWSTPIKNGGGPLKKSQTSLAYAQIFMMVWLQQIWPVDLELTTLPFSNVFRELSIHKWWDYFDCNTYSIYMTNGNYWHYWVTQR